MLASDIDPGTTGYLIAIATDRSGCPINFNYLIGDEYVKFATGHQVNLAAESIAAIAGGLPTCNLNSDSVQLNFNGVSYNPVPRVLAASNLQSRADGNDTLLIVDRIGGSLISGASTLFGLFGLLYDDAERGVSFQIPGATRCQYRASLTTTTCALRRVTTRSFPADEPAGCGCGASLMCRSSAYRSIAIRMRARMRGRSIRGTTCTS